MNRVQQNSTVKFNLLTAKSASCCTFPQNCVSLKCHILQQLLNIVLSNQFYTVR